MKPDRVVVTLFSALVVLVFLGTLVFVGMAGLKGTNISIRTTQRDRAVEIEAASRARVEESRARAWEQMQQAYAQALLTQANAQAEATTRQASAEALATRSMALLPWALLLLVALVVLVILFRRQPIPQGKNVVFILPAGADRQVIRDLLGELQPHQVRGLPAPEEKTGGRAIIIRK